MTENVININGKDYAAEDMNEQQTYLIDQIRSCQRKLADMRFELDQVQAAQNVFTNQLIRSVEKTDEGEEVA
jgi:TolA-binding protein